MLKTVLFAALASAALTAVPAIASPAGAGAEGAKIDTSAIPTPAPAREVRYCVISTITGSRIPQKECHTRKDWIAMTGEDPLAKN